MRTRKLLLMAAAEPGALDLYTAQVREVASAEQALLSRGDGKRALDRPIAQAES